MPIVLFFFDLLCGIMFAFLTYDYCLKYPIKGLLECIRGKDEQKKFQRLLKATAAVIGLILLILLIAVFLIIEAIIIWVLLYVIFTIPCMILYVIVFIRKQYVWKVEEKVKKVKSRNKDPEAGPNTNKESNNKHKISESGGSENIEE